VVRQDRLLERIIGFFGERLFGPHKRDLLEHDLRSLDDEPEVKHQRPMRSLRRALDKLEGAQARFILTLEVNADPDGVVFGGSGSCSV